MKVYRVENVRGYGPYSANYRDSGADLAQKALNRDMADDHFNNYKSHPTPRQEDMAMFMVWEEDTRFAFKTKRELKAWFAGYEERLSLCGYAVVAYRVSKSDIEEGEYQVAFNINDAERLGMS